jgi:hypothetical protein
VASKNFSTSDACSPAAASIRTRATITAEVGESFLTCGFVIPIDETLRPLFRAFLSGPDDAFGLNIRVVPEEQLLKRCYVGFEAKEGLIYAFLAGKDLFA